ncbi:MAG: hypothetical protein UT05_C0007G0005 [Parcubacteria group bacterium GW2011_GWF2_38_76]|nr:MAG: hypothetical protein UT05_C0007G0005 [Parcubacteria group bacterium GW2011_GWF2_38_76]HBM46119.1 hypothetical protein [Patescibacteria group bacterium]
MIKEFFMKQMLNRAMKDAPVPVEQKEMLMNMVMKNPALFQKIAEEAQSLIKDKGLDQMTAVMQVAEKYKEELKGLAK